MVLRVVAIVTAFLAFVNCKPASLEKSEKCDYCKHFLKTGLSPYEVLWTLKEEIGRALPSQVLERKMLMKTEDIKMAEGIFLEYCRHNCRQLFENRRGEEVMKTLAKKGKILHFLSAEEEEKFTKLAKQEFKKPKKKPDKHVAINYVRKKAKESPKETLRKPKPEYDETDEKYLKLYQNVLFGTGVLDRTSGSRSLQNLKNPGNTTTPNPEVIPRQSPNTNETSEAKPTESPQSDGMTTTEQGESATEAPKDDTQTTTVVEAPEPSTSPKPKESSSEAPEKDDFDLDDLFSGKDFTDEDSEESEEKPAQTQKDKPDVFEKLVDDLIDLAAGDEAIKSISKSILQTTDFVKCMLDLILTEIETALGIPSGLLVRERCSKNLESSMSSLDIGSIFAPIIKNIETQQMVSNLVPPTQNFGVPNYGYPGPFVGLPAGYGPPGFSPVEPYREVYFDEPPPYYPFETSRSLSTGRSYSAPHYTPSSVTTFRDFVSWKKFNSRHPYSALEREIE